MHVAWWAMRSPEGSSTGHSAQLGLAGRLVPQPPVQGLGAGVLLDVEPDRRVAASGRGTLESIDQDGPETPRTSARIGTQLPEHGYAWVLLVVDPAHRYRCAGLVENQQVVRAVGHPQEHVADSIQVRSRARPAASVKVRLEQATHDNLHETDPRQPCRHARLPPQPHVNALDDGDESRASRACATGHPQNDAPVGPATTGYAQRREPVIGWCVILRLCLAGCIPVPDSR